MKTNWKRLTQGLIGRVLPDSGDTGGTQSVSGSGEIAMSDKKTKAINIGRRQIAGVYANAILGAAQSSNSTDVVLEEFGGFVREVVGAQPKFQALLESPRVKSEEKIQLLDKVLSGKVSQVTLRFLKVVAEHGRLDCLDEIYEEARRLYNESKGIVQVVVTTAEPIESHDVSAIRDALGQKFGAPLDLEMKVDPKMIGGVVVRIGDKLFDGSVAQKLRSLREDAVKNTVKQMREATDKFATSS